MMITTSVSKIIEQLNTGISMNKLADRLGLHRQTISRKLNCLGYAFNYTSRKWEWNGEGSEPLSRDFLERIRTKEFLKTNTVELENGYSIQIHKETISHVGRSIFRDLDKEVTVLEICNPEGQVTKRLPIPSRYAAQVAEVMAQ